MGAATYRQAIRGKRYPAEVIQGCILRRLREEIASKLDGDFQAVITVPAYFDEARRKATADAATMSGLSVLAIVNEPTAAALAFGERLGYLSAEGAPSSQLRVLVYDLGGGTFDATVMQLSADGIQTLATDGDFELGGLHWDERLVDHVQSRLAMTQPELETTLSNVEQIQLRRAAQQAKHTLSEDPLATVDVTLQGVDHRLPISREEFEQLTADLVEWTAFTTKQVLKSAGLLWKDIDRLLLVGGSTRMPAVRKMLHQLTDLTAEHAVDPDEAVARGAAIYAR